MLKPKKSWIDLRRQVNRERADLEISNSNATKYDSKYDTYAWDDIIQTDTLYLK